MVVDQEEELELQPDLEEEINEEEVNGLEEVYEMPSLTKRESQRQNYKKLFMTKKDSIRNRSKPAKITVLTVETPEG